MIMSTTLLPLIKEVLEHKSMKHDDIVGTDIDMMKLLMQYMSSLNNCLMFHLGRP